MANEIEENGDRGLAAELARGAANSPGVAPASSEGFTGEELLGRLEERWASLAKTVIELRNEVRLLEEQLLERENASEGVETELQRLREEVEGLRLEKSRTVSRIEALLVRLDELEG
ncbi:MAG: hypothetical protein HQL59_11715 [Magnetococcales bacterium]|nr:hypothetical protein [Magnetococcales bacterium]